MNTSQCVKECGGGKGGVEETESVQGMQEAPIFCPGKKRWILEAWIPVSTPSLVISSLCHKLQRALNKKNTYKHLV